MIGETGRSCPKCNEALLADAITCRHCRAFDRSVSVCPQCAQPYPPGVRYCAIDGATLGEPLGDARNAMTIGEDNLSTGLDSADGFAGLVEQARAFWQRHLILNGITLVALAAWVGFLVIGSGGMQLMGMGLTIPLALSWPIALANSSKALGFVNWIDKWYARMVDFFEGWDGRVGRWVMYPVVWAGGNWAVFASRRGDRFVAASLRMFGYSIALMFIVLLAIVTVYIVIGLVMLAVGLWLLGAVFGDDDDDKRSSRRMPMVGQRDRGIYEGDGGWLSTDKRVGKSKREK